MPRWIDVNNQRTQVVKIKSLHDFKIEPDACLMVWDMRVELKADDSPHFDPVSDLPDCCQG